MLKIFKNPKNFIITGVVICMIGMIDSVINGASDYTSLGIIGKTSFIIILLMIGFWFLKTIWGLLKGFFKKKR